MELSSDETEDDCEKMRCIIDKLKPTVICVVCENIREECIYCKKRACKHCCESCHKKLYCKVSTGLTPYYSVYGKKIVFQKEMKCGYLWINGSSNMITGVDYNKLELLNKYDKKMVEVAGTIYW